MAEPMPLQMSKGLLIRNLETRWNDPLNGKFHRAVSLWHWLKCEKDHTTWFDVGHQDTGDLTEDERHHLATHWFGPPAGAGVTEPNFFTALKLEDDPQHPGVIAKATVKPLTTAGAKAGERPVRFGLITALSASLGLDGDQEDNLGKQSKNNYPQYISDHQANWAGRYLELFWICGKGDAFECVVSWNPVQVNLLIFTPPLSHIADETLGGFPATAVPDAPRYDPRGVILVRPDGTKALLTLDEGGSR